MSSLFVYTPRFVHSTVYTTTQVVSKQDALDVVAIMHTALLDTVTDEYGCIDLTRTSQS